MHGGGMRQAGILAAAGLFALEHHRERLVEDHANAKAMAEALAGAPGIQVDLTRVHTNIVMLDFERGTAQAVVELAREEGVLLGTAGAHRVRAVTHLDIDRDGVQRAAKVISEIAAKL
jgi:threonine aldolase